MFEKILYLSFIRHILSHFSINVQSFDKKFLFFLHFIIDLSYKNIYHLIIEVRMKYTYEVKNIDCAQCAKHLEASVARIRGFSNVQYNFATMILTFESELISEEFLPELQRAIYRTEPDAEIIHDNSPISHKRRKFDIHFALFLLGVVIGFCGWLVPMPVVAKLILITVGVGLLLYKTAFKAFMQLFKAKTIGESLLITIAALGAYGLGLFRTISEDFSELGEGLEESLIVIILYSVGKMLESSVLKKSRKNISSLLEVQPEFAMIVHGNHEHKVHPKDVKIGATIRIRPGERVPLDGVVISGSASVDTSHITGESLPRAVKQGAEVLSGTIILDGVIELQTTSMYKDSTVSRIMNLIDNANDKKSKTETVINRFAKWYTLAVLSVAVVVLLVYAILGNIVTGIEQSLILLFISCPCAFAISVPLAYFSALGKASKNGILIKGSNYLDVAAKLNHIYFDKTGTLTTGDFAVKEVITLNKKYSTQDILKFAALGEQNSIHPIARAITHKAHGITLEKVENFVENSGSGVSFTYKNDVIFVGNVTRSNSDELTSVQIIVNEKPVGKILLADSLKPRSVATCEYLRSRRITLSMLSGDNQKVTSHIAEILGIEDYHAGLTPEQKYQILETHLDKQSKGEYTAFVGDGINDAPSLSRADLGISMGLAGSPATVEASDIVVVDDNPSKIADLIKLSKFARGIVWQNIIFAIVTKLLVVILDITGVLAASGFGMIIAVIGDVGVTLLAILNSLRIFPYNFGRKRIKQPKTMGVMVEAEMHNHTYSENCSCVGHKHDKNCGCGEHKHEHSSCSCGCEEHKHNHDNKE